MFYFNKLLWQHNSVKKIAFIFSFFLIYGCSNDSISAPNQIPQILDSEIPLFNPNPIILEDAVSYYSNACNNPSFQFLIPVHINDDNFIDFIAHFWCDSETPAEISDENVPDSLVVYLSDSNGNYVTNNQEIFGEPYPKLGGASRKYARGDINGDGKDDFALLEEMMNKYDFNNRWSKYKKTKGSKNFLYTQNHAYFNLALSTGMRRGELLALNWSDIDFDNATLDINKSWIRAKSG